MCKNGINLTQFKLSIHQLSNFAETIERSIEQWSELTSSLGLKSLSESLQEAKINAETLKKLLERSISVADDAEASDEGVSITPL
ncbi:MAG: hypothetical protein N2440_03035 [Actinobacteria bacterium]|nr:hypothetical protein [Actinomycetota bacterium]